MNYMRPTPHYIADNWDDASKIISALNHNCIIDNEQPFSLKIFQSDFDNGWYICNQWTPDEPKLLKYLELTTGETTDYIHRLAERYLEIDNDFESDTTIDQVLKDFTTFQKQCPMALYYIEFLIDNHILNTEDE